MLLLSELGVKLSLQLVLYSDNIRDAYLYANLLFHLQMKNIIIYYHFVREFVQRGLLRVAHVTSTDQLADVLTRSLSRLRLHDLFILQDWCLWLAILRSLLMYILY